MPTETSQDDSQRSGATACSCGLAVWCDVDADLICNDHKWLESSWHKKIVFPCLPPLKTNIFPIHADHDGSGVFVVEEIHYNERGGYFHIDLRVEEPIDFAESGWLPGLHHKSL